VKSYHKYKTFTQYSLPSRIDIQKVQNLLTNISRNFCNFTTFILLCVEKTVILFSLNTCDEGFNKHVHVIHILEGFALTTIFSHCIDNSNYQSY